MDSQEISLTFKNKIENLSELKKYEERLTKINSQISAIKSGQKGVAGLEKETKTTQKAVDNTTKSVEKMGKQLNFAFNISAMTAYTKALTGLFTKLQQFTMKSVNYVENINLLEVAYHNANETIEESSARIEDFIDKMSEVYGLDESDLARKLGIFKQLANAMQLPTQEAEHLSELMVKMTNDIASLYNLDLNRASNALQSALAGQVRPIRSATGADITEKTLQNTVDALGLDRSISELSFVEKRLIMVISLTNQLKNSQGDYARTIESASNQIRIMKEQFDRLSRAVGNVFYKTLEGIMPYINGLLMALTEIFNLIATLLGFEMPEFDYRGLSSVSDYAMDLEDSLAGAGENADKLNNKLKGLRGFDKLNVINTPTSAGSAGGGGAGGGIDPTIMDAFNKAFSEYDDKMNSVRMKAHDIRDSIMEWLGFTKLVNEETGKITWVYNGSNEVIDSIVQTVKDAIPHLKNIWEYSKKIFGGVLAEFFKDLASGPYGTIMKTMLQIIEKIFEVIANNEFLIKMIAKLFELKLLTGFITNLGKVNNVLGTAGLFGIIKKIYTPTVNLFKDMVKYSKEWGGSLSAGVELWRAESGMIDVTTGKIKGFSGAMAMGKTALEGLVGAGIGLVTVDTAIKDINENGMNLANTLGLIGGELTTMSSLATTGASIGGALGGAIGFTAGAFINLADALFNAKDPFDEIIQKQQEYIDKQNDLVTAINDATIKEFAQIDANSLLINSLGEVVDSNGKVKDGYEDRANIILGKLNEAFGTEYKLVDGQITLNDNEAQSYDNVKTSIEKLIEEKKKQLALQSFEQQYQQVMQNQLDLQDKIKERQEILTRQQEWYENALKGTGDTGGYTYKELEEGIKYSKEQLKLLNDQQATNQDKLQEYGEVFEVFAKGTDEEIKKVMEDYGLSMDNASEKVDKNMSNSEKSVGKVIDKAKELSKKINDMVGVKQTTIEVDANTVPFMQKISNMRANLQDFMINIKGKANGGVFANGQWHDVTAYGTGGLPPVGQMFVARERGPELVGTIGGHTAVMNNDQIVGSVSNGVYQAVRSAMGNQNQGTQVFNIYLDEEHKIGTYTLDQLQNMAKSNGKAITLG